MKKSRYTEEKLVGILEELLTVLEQAEVLSANWVTA